MWILLVGYHNSQKEGLKMEKRTLLEWQEQMMEQVEGTVFLSCIMDSVPYHANTKRYQVYNEEGTYDETFDITTDDDGYIINVE
mgnify:CR=1 FL=1